VTDSKVN